MNNIKVEIKKSGINGEGIGYFKRKPVFVDGCFPQEIIECDLSDKGRYYIGTLKRIIRKSKYRIKSNCRHHKDCGGCSLICLDYKKQLEIKKELLKEALYKYASYNEEIDDIVASDDVYNYRNKCNLPVVEYHGKLTNALYRMNSNRPVIIDECLIHDTKLEHIRKQVLDILNNHNYRAYNQKDKKGIRQLIIRGFKNEYQLVIVTGNNDIDDVVKELKNIKELVSIYQGINTLKNPLNYLNCDLKLLHGKEKIMMELGRYRMNLSAQAFFQLNYSQAHVMYKKVAELLPDKCEKVIEAYCGIGAISLFISDKAKKIYGIEIVEEAINDAKDNVKINNIENIEFICSDASKTVNRLVKNNDIDVLIVDPPRTGLDNKLLQTVMESNINNIIYMSCNPATLAKDLSVLLKKYNINYIQGYDMFPNTPLVETIVKLSKNR